jgi:hypothetical protein
MKENECMELYFKTGVFAEKYEGVIEIYPRKAMCSQVLDIILKDMQEQYDIVQITNEWFRAFKKVK